MGVRPGYKQTEVGLIPDDWEVMRLSDHFKIYAGGDVPMHSYSQDRSENHPYPIFANSLQNKGLYGFTGERRAPKNSLTITARGYLGHAEYRNEEFFPIVRLLVLEPLGDLEPRFTTLAVNERVKFAFESTGVPQLTAPQVGSYFISAPALEEQRKIADVIADFDALLTAQDALIAKKHAIKQGAMQALLTGKRRLPGFSDRWKVRRLGDHLEFLSNGANSRAELSDEGWVRYLHYGDIHSSNDVRLNPACASMPFLPESKSARLDRLQEGDLVFADASEDIDGVGKSVELDNVGSLEVVSGMHTIAVRFDKAILADGFKAYLQMIPSFHNHLRRLASGTKVYATNMAHIASAELQLPDVDEQVAISSVLLEMDNEIAALQQQRAKTAQLKQGMMQQLLTGRIRLI